MLIQVEQGIIFFRLLQHFSLFIQYLVYGVSRYDFIFIYSAWHHNAPVNQRIPVFQQFWKVLCHFPSNIASCQFHLLSRMHNTFCIACYLYLSSHGLLVSLCFQTINFINISLFSSLSLGGKGWLGWAGGEDFPSPSSVRLWLTSFP